MPLMQAISVESLARLFDLGWLVAASTETLLGFSQFVLAVAWSLSFLSLMVDSTFHECELAVRRVGQELDARARPSAGREKRRGDGGDIS